MINLGNTGLDRCSAVVAALGALFAVGVVLLQLGVSLGLLSFGVDVGRSNVPYNLPLYLTICIAFLAWIAAPFILVIRLATSNEWPLWAKTSLLLVAVGIGALSYHLLINLLNGPFTMREKGGIAVAILPFIQFFVVLALVGCVSLVRSIAEKR